MVSPCFPWQSELPSEGNNMTLVPIIDSHDNSSSLDVNFTGVPQTTCVPKIENQNENHEHAAEPADTAVASGVKILS